jgi:hypothetical protein
VDQADWLIGANIFTAAFKGHALRDMANPGTAYDDPMLGKDPQPGHMKDYVQTQDDNGGVHINSGIPNKAFVLAAKAIGGRAWEVTGKIWYVTLTERLTSSADFEKCARETISVARDLFPSNPSIAATIAQAWTDVGVIAAGDAMVASVATAAAPAPAITAAAPTLVGTASAAKALGLTPAPAKAKKRVAHHREKPQQPNQRPQ